MFCNSISWIRIRIAFEPRSAGHFRSTLQIRFVDFGPQALGPPATARPSRHSFTVASAAERIGGRAPKAAMPRRRRAARRKEVRFTAPDEAQRRPPTHPKAVPWKLPRAFGRNLAPFTESAWELPAVGVEGGTQKHKIHFPLIPSLIGGLEMENQGFKSPTTNPN